MPFPRSLRLSALIGGLLLLIAASFLIGRYQVPPATVIAVLAARIWPALYSLYAAHFYTPRWAPEIDAVIWAVRLPRLLAALLVGSALSVSGAAYQGLFRNPMVSPDILGVSAGAGCGAALAILLGFGMAGIQGCAFVFGLAAVTVTWAIGASLGRRGDAVLVMVLAGIIVGTLFGALVSLVKFAADPTNTLPSITYWLMGSLASAGIGDVTVAAAPILLGGVALLAMAWQLNVLSFGDEEARAMGLATGRLRLAIIVFSTLTCAAAVAISGVIGLVGLIVPHLARMLVGPDHRILLPVSALMGGGFLLAVDDLARALFEAELPLGVVTAIVGAPFFLYLLYRNHVRNHVRNHARNRNAASRHPEPEKNHARTHRS